MTWTPPVYEEWEAGDRVFDDMLREQVLDNLVYLLGAVNVALGVGNIILSGRAAPPTGFLLCDGAEIVRADYPDLFAAIGTAYGAGDGTTTFKIPDLRQRFPIGKAVSGTASVLGATGGVFGHSHTLASTGSQGAHTHPNPATNSGGSHAHPNPATNAGGSHNHGGWSYGATKTGVTGGHSFAGIGSDPQDHQHGVVNQASHTHTQPATTSAGAHTHTQPATTSAGAHTHTNPNPTGTADPPWLALNYIIRVTPFG